MLSFVLLWPYQPVVLGKKSFLVDDLVFFLHRAPLLKVTKEVEKQEMKSHTPEPIRERRHNGGAKEVLLLAVERENGAAIQAELDREEQRNILKDWQGGKEGKRQHAAREAQRKADEDARRKEEAHCQAKEHNRRAEIAAERQGEEEANRHEVAWERTEAGEHNRKSEMVSVPAGKFFRGCNEEVDKECNNNEKPGRQFYVDAFEIDKTEVTVAAYQQCVDAGRCSAPIAAKICNWQVSGRENHPIDCVDVHQAKAYCEWAGKRLPTEAEWEKAARGTDGRKYPWGSRSYGEVGKVANIADKTAKQHDGRITWAVEGYDDGFYDTAPVGSFPAGASPYGALDMIGNVWEWVADRYDKELTHASVRGGAWNNGPQSARASYHGRVVPGYRSASVGFRCAR